MKITDPTFPSLLFEMTQQVYQELFGENQRPHAGCLYWAIAASEAMSRLGKLRDVMIQAGTATWSVSDAGAPDEVDEYGYVYSGGEETEVDGVRAMPEIHCWNIITGEGSAFLFDATAGFQVKRFEGELGGIWDTSTYPMPPFIWFESRQDDIPAWRYTPHPEAIAYAYRLAAKIYHQKMTTGMSFNLWPPAQLGYGVTANEWELVKKDR